MNRLEEIARVIREEAERLGVRVERIILFGSRARGDHRGDSDYGWGRGGLEEKEEALTGGEEEA